MLCLWNRTFLTRKRTPPCCRGPPTQKGGSVWTSDPFATSDTLLAGIPSCARIVVRRDDVGNPGYHVRANSTGRVSYTLRSFQPSTTVQVRTAFADYRVFDALVVCYSIATEDYQCDACPTGDSAFQRLVWGISLSTAWPCLSPLLRCAQML